MCHKLLWQINYALCKVANLSIMQRYAFELTRINSNKSTINQHSMDIKVNVIKRMKERIIRIRRLALLNILKTT